MIIRAHKLSVMIEINDRKCDQMFYYQNFNTAFILSLYFVLFDFMTHKNSSFYVRL